MYGINLSKIYMEIARRYKCHKFEVFNNMNSNGTLPIESMFEFHIPLNTQIDLKKLTTMLDKHIKSVRFFYVYVEGTSIVLVIKYHKRNTIIGHDYEFCKN